MDIYIWGTNLREGVMWDTVRNVEMKRTRATSFAGSAGES